MNCLHSSWFSINAFQHIQAFNAWCTQASKLEATKLESFFNAWILPPREDIELKLRRREGRNKGGYGINGNNVATNPNEIVTQTCSSSSKWNGRRARKVQKVSHGRLKCLTRLVPPCQPVQALVSWQKNKNHPIVVWKDLHFKSQDMGWSSWSFFPQKSLTKIFPQRARGVANKACYLIKTQGK